MSKTPETQKENPTIKARDKFIWKDGDVELIKDPELVKKIIEYWLESHRDLEKLDISFQSSGDKTQ